ncbi:MAG: gliding motility-associated C-terminal domain-containing protein, partial [Saprospiraceae bacterium]|nr:gliding motility-associated C-terminal domain-containing protein [Saprospiraceae bacterium]
MAVLFRPKLMKSIYLFFPALFAVAALHAQPIPCGPVPDMTSFCDQACIICDIDGYTGINSDPQQGEAPPGFCTTQVHHMQWLGFIAGSTNLTLEVSVSNCQNGEGLEIGIYQTLDCETFQLVTNCDTDIPANTTGVFTNTVPLVIGQYYFFVMDGSQDDVCNFTVKVLNGTTNVSALATSGVLAGDTKACIETPSVFALSPPTGATVFEWALNGVKVSAGPDTSLVVNWPAPGLYNVCVTSSNTCDTAAPVCQTVIVNQIPPTLVQAQICPGECFDVADTMLCDAGVYDFHYTGSEGCDSLLRVTVQEIPSVTTGLDLFICEGDSIFVGPHAYFSSGQFQDTLPSLNGCDSIVNLALQVVVCEIQGNLNVSAAQCHGTASGSLQFSIEDGTPPFNYSWERIGTSSPFGTGAIAALNVPQTIPNLPVGTYFITVSDNFGNDVILFGDVSEPPPLSAQIQLSDYHGFQVSCFGSADGTADLTASGGNPPYTFAWDNAGTSAQLTNLTAGSYLCTVTDESGCTLSIQAGLTAPAELVLEAQFDNPGCDGVNTGLVKVLSTSGGVAPYTFDLSGKGFGSATEFADLPPGNYSLTVQDANGCTGVQSAIFVAPLIPEIDLGPDLTVDLGESVLFQLVYNVPLDTFIWSPLPGLSCYDCPEPEATPYHTTMYILSVEAPGGCTDTDSISVKVLNKRDVYVPNTFSPNDDGINETFTVFGGPEVLTVNTLQVYSRWGELIFRKDGLDANDEQAGWNGTYRGKDLPPGVFTWLAEVAFLDGVVLVYKGSVTVVR